jgi:transcriptional regulator GlxA family with amidase domain
MNPKLIGFLGFEGVAASELTRAADLLAAATLDGGYGNRISCYHVCTIGFTSECFRSESGITFRPDSTLETVSELDTIVVPGGDGLRRSLVSERIADWILARSCLTVNRLIGLRNSIRWRAERACLRAILIGPLKVCSGVRRGSLWRICA